MSQSWKGPFSVSLALRHEQREMNQKSVIIQVQCDLTGIIVTFENNHRLLVSLWNSLQGLLVQTLPKCQYAQRVTILSSA